MITRESTGYPSGTSYLRSWNACMPRYRAQGIEYRVIGGLAVFFQVSARDPDAARVTRDVDIAVDRGDLDRIAKSRRKLRFPAPACGRHRYAGERREVPRPRARFTWFSFARRFGPTDLSAIPGFSEPTEDNRGISSRSGSRSGPYEAHQFSAQGQNPHHRHGFGRTDHAGDRSRASGCIARALEAGSRRRPAPARSLLFEDFRERNCDFRDLLVRNIPSSTSCISPGV